MTTGARPDYARMFTSAPAPLLVLEPDPPRFTIVDATDAYLDATVTRREEIVGNGVFEVFPDPPVELRASLDRVIETRAADASCWPVLSADGDVRFILHRHEDGASELASRVKAAFLTNMSHELRTPLNSIIGFSDLLHEDAVELAPSHREHLRYIRESGRHLLRLVNDLVDLTRIEAGRVTLLREPVALAPLAAQVRDQLKPQAEAGGVSVVLDIRDDLPRVDADAARLIQILTHLVSNGIKFTPRTGMVRLTAERQGDMMAIAVADTGVGLAAGDLPRIFRAFEQIGDGRRRRAEGTGLGLALTRALVELHRGEITVASTPSRGSTFTVLLPIAVATVRALAADATGSLPLASEEAHTVLLVEDDVLNQKLAHAVLTRRGYIVSVAASLPEARAVLRHIVPSVIVTDIEFPDGGGRRLLEELRGDPRLASIPVLAMTAHALDGERDRLLHAGFDAYLSKPIAIDELARQVEALINARSGRPKR